MDEETVRVMQGEVEGGPCLAAGPEVLRSGGHCVSDDVIGREWLRHASHQ